MLAQYLPIFLCIWVLETTKTFDMWCEVNLQSWISYYTRRIWNENLTLGMQIRHDNRQQTFPLGCCRHELKRLLQPHASDQESLHTRLTLLRKYPAETNGAFSNEFQWARYIEVFYSGCRDSSVLRTLDQKFTQASVRGHAQTTNIFSRLSLESKSHLSGMQTVDELITSMTHFLYRDSWKMCNIQALLALASQTQHMQQPVMQSVRRFSKEALTGCKTSQWQTSVFRRKDVTEEARKNSPSASLGLQWPDGEQGRGDEELEAYCRRTRPSVHLSHTDPTSLGNQQKQTKCNLDTANSSGWQVRWELTMWGFIF